MGEGFLLKDVLSLVSANISSLCRRAKGCALLTCILPWTERTRLFAVLSVYCSTCCYLGQDYNRMSCFRMWLVFSWVRRTIFFLVPNLTSGNIVNYCVLFSRALTSGGSWRQDIGYSPYSLTALCQYRVPSYCLVGVLSFFALDTDSCVQRWRNFPCY